jgi:uncharacterized protein
VGLQKRFFGHFLKGEDTGWDRQPPVQLNVRHVDGRFELRAELQWPLAAADTEITGPAAARLFVASSTADADLFLTLRVLDAAGADVNFVTALDPAGVIGMGWLRASHRALAPGEVVPLDVEIWPTSVVVPADYRLALTVQGRDFEFPGDGPWPTTYGVAMKGHGMFLHDDPDDRPAEVFGGTTTLVSGPEHPSHLLLPIIPRAQGGPLADPPRPVPPVMTMVAEPPAPPAPLRSPESDEDTSPAPWGPSE